MDTKKIVLAILSTVAKVAVLAVALIFIYKAAVKAYDFGYAIFEDKAVSEAPGREVNVSIAEGKSAKEIGEILESKGLIKDATIFYFQNLLSSHRDKLMPGVYTLNTSMAPSEMMEIMSTVEETGTEDGAEAE